ncbi:MAG: APC family permease, partial [Eubacteriales bacterium]|nr:APC family permease [Eubacteriales bacterium]
MSVEESRYITSDVKKHGLKSRKVGSLSVFFMIFCLCCGGGFGIAELIPESGPGLTIIMLCVLPFIWSTPMGLAASELGSARPQEGGYYKWVQEALGEFWGFQSGWWRTISIYIDNTLYVILAAGYVGMMWDLSWGAEMAMKVGMIVLFTYINLRGIKDVGVVSTIISLIVIFAFILVSICGFANWSGNPLVPFTADGTITGVTGIPFADWVYYIGMGIAIGMWLYSGYESISTVAEEIENPQRVIPIPQALAVPAIMAAYIVPTIAS